MLTKILLLIILPAFTILATESDRFRCWASSKDSLVYVFYDVMEKKSEIQKYVIGSRKYDPDDPNSPIVEYQDLVFDSKDYILQYAFKASPHADTLIWNNLVLKNSKIIRAQFSWSYQKKVVKIGNTVHGCYSDSKAALKNPSPLGTAQRKGGREKPTGRLGLFNFLGRLELGR